MKITVNAYAKLNLTLDIEGVRADGFHLLKMIMQSVDLHDTITILRTDDRGEIELRSNDNRLDNSESNTIIKAARLFFNETGMQGGLSIRLKKRIPITAGLGGGSADAAAALLGLNRLFNTNLSNEKLYALGTGIGSDVAFCLLGGTALVEGTGGIITPLFPLCDCYLVLSKPADKPSTAEMFRIYDTAGAKEHPDTQKMVEDICAGDLPAIGSGLVNVFGEIWTDEAIVKTKAEMLKMGALGSSISGSGPTVFGLFDDRHKAENAANELQKSCDEVFLCRPVNTGCEIVD